MQYVSLDSLFYTRYGHSLELNGLEQVEKPCGVNFVSRAMGNNGVTARVQTSEVPGKVGEITVALGGNGVLSSFVQPEPFVCGRDVMILTAKDKDMSISEKLWWCACIWENRFRYSYGKQANRTLAKLMIPSRPPAYVGTKNPSAPTTVNRSPMLLQPATGWSRYRIKDIFESFGKGKANAGLVDDGNDYFYLAAKKSNNGVMRRVTAPAELVTPGNCLIFIGNGQGSVGYTNYIGEDFVGTTDLTTAYSPHLNKYNAQFLVTVLDMERPKFSHGRKWTSRIADTVIRLPANGDDPDWQYMESYIKSLPYADLI